MQNSKIKFKNKFQKFMIYSLDVAILIVLTLIVSISPTSAQNTDEFIAEQEMLENSDKPVEITDVQGLRAEFVQHLQNPGNKQIEFEMILKSGVTSDRVRITWYVTGASRAVDEADRTKTISIEAGKTYSTSIKVVPTRSGVSEVYGVAKVFGVDGNVVATVRKNYATNNSREILPLSEEYKSSKILNTVLNFVKIGGGILLLAFGSVFGFKKFVRWYNTDERDTFEKNRPTHNIPFPRA